MASECVLLTMDCFSDSLQRGSLSHYAHAQMFGGRQGLNTFFFPSKAVFEINPESKQKWVVVCSARCSHVNSVPYVCCVSRDGGVCPGVLLLLPSMC